MALGETQIVQETRQFLLDNQVSLDSFSQVRQCNLSLTTCCAPLQCTQLLALCTCHSVISGRCPEEHDRDSGEKPSSRSGGCGAGGTLCFSRLPGPCVAASVRPHRHSGVPGAHRGQESLQEVGLQQGAWRFSLASLVVKQPLERVVTLYPTQFQHVPLYLEWAPTGVFVAAKPELGKPQCHNLLKI